MRARRPLADKVQIVLDAPQMSSDAGLLLLKKTDQKSGLLQRMTPCLTDTRRPAGVRHTKLKMLAQRV